MALSIIRVRKINGAQTAHWSDVTEQAAVTIHTRTLCGRPMTLGDWAEVIDGKGWSRLIGYGPAFVLQPCARCDAKLSKIREADHAAALAEDAARTVPDVVTREWVPDMDTYSLVVNGEIVGTVDSTRDHTGDRFARRTGERYVIAPRFTDTSEAEAYLRGETGIPDRCPVQGVHAYGGCIRAAGHYGPHSSAQRHQWTDQDDERMREEARAFRRAAEERRAAAQKAQEARAAQERQDTAARDDTAAISLLLHPVHCNCLPCREARATDSTPRELTESEYDELSATVRAALYETCMDLGMPASADVVSRVADDAANALSRYGIRR